MISSYYLSLHLLYLFFFAAASLPFVHFLNVLYKMVPNKGDGSNLMVRLGMKDREALEGCCILLQL